MKDKKQKCEAFFKGKDGLGTCDTKCIWYSKDCPLNNKNKSSDKGNIK